MSPWVALPKHQYWVHQEARMEVAEDEETFVDRCDRVMRSLGKSRHVESPATTSTPRSWRGDYAQVGLSCVVVATSPNEALDIAVPIFTAALEAGDLARPDQWFQTKIHRLSALA